MSPSHNSSPVRDAHLRRLVCAVSLGLITVTLLGCADRRHARTHEYVLINGQQVLTLSVRNDDSDRSDRVEMRPGEALAVRLEAEAGRGYAWALASREWDQAVLELLDRPREPFTPPAGQSLGEPRWDVFNFRAGREGTTRVRFHLVRPTDPDVRPINRYEVTVRVNP